MLRTVPKKIWIYTALVLAFTISAGFAMRGGPMLRGTGFRSDITIANLEIDVGKLTRKTSLMAPTLNVKGDMTSDSPERVYQIDLRLNLYSCPADAAEGIEDCTLAMELLVSPNVDLEPGETVAFTGNAYLDARALPIAPEIRWTYKVKQVYTR